MWQVALGHRGPEGFFNGTETPEKQTHCHQVYKPLFFFPGNNTYFLT